MAVVINCLRSVQCVLVLDRREVVVVLVVGVSQGRRGQNVSRNQSNTSGNTESLPDPENRRVGS